MSAASVSVGSVVGGFRVETPLDRGGMGVVYRATQLSLGRVVALKVVAPELAADARFRDRFLREAHIAASIAHPHLLPVYDAGETDGVLFLAMRLVEGVSLAELLAREGRLEAGRAASLAAQVAGALERAHRAGLVHRDVKPANILVEGGVGSEHAYLCDFGLSRRVASVSALTRPEGFVGSAAYAAPEQIRGDTVDGRADVYALGCVLFECLTGRRPYERQDELALMWAHMHAPPSRPSDADPALAPFDGVIERALAKDPAERYVTVIELGEAAVRAARGDAGTVAVHERPGPPVDLPIPATPFLGRERELAEVAEMLLGEARLVTLTGPGGTGKTRLALRAAEEAAAAFPDGVYWVGLASVRNPALVTETIAQALEAVQGLEATIAERRLLLLLDNFEQVVEAAPDLAALLQACPNLSLLVTSRETLRVQAETEYAVPPLVEAEAVDLFCARSRLEPSGEIAELCARLDNLPLAVELAAARTKVLSPTQILERVSQRLDLLRGGRDADARQRTLRATIEWSYDLLTPEEQRLFRALSVFAGGCTLEAAEAVADADLDTLHSLVEKSLLRFTDERYWMLETIREYGGERARESAEGDELGRRHRAWFVGLAEKSGIDVYQPDANKLLSSTHAAATLRLAVDFANIRQAVTHALTSNEPDDIGRVVAPLFPFLVVRGHASEACGWVESALAQREFLSPRGLAAVLLGGGEILRFAGDSSRAAELKREALLLVEDVREFSPWIPFTLADLCEISIENGEFGLAREYAARSAATGGGVRIAGSLSELCLREGDLESAESHALVALAGYEEGQVNRAGVLEVLGEIARRGGDDAKAQLLFCDALRAYSDLGDGGGAADCLDGLSRLAAKAGNADRAGLLRGASQRVREISGRVPARSDVEWPELPEDARAKGSAMTLDEAVAYALAPGAHRTGHDVPAPTSAQQRETMPTTNLPRPASSFVGREVELGEVLSRFEQGARLVTLTGPGGSGKTRLALETAATLVPQFKAGVFWIGLAALRDPTLVTESVAQTLGAKDGLAEHIGERELLLLLDNLEQVIDAAPDLSALLRACPNLRLLVTSRELLRVEGEIEYAVPPLAEPEAVALFCERAQTEPSYEIRELCARLDNLPLAVELAAARTKALSPAQILERLSQRLDLLRGGRDTDPRQQTLRATIKWSYDLLDSEERRLFRALSIFAGGCTLEAAERATGADLDILQSLVEKSLLRYTDERYWMLETIREFGGDRLAAAGETAETRLRFSEEMARFVRTAAEEAAGAEALASRIEPEYANIRTVLAPSQEVSRELRLALAAQLFHFWDYGGHYTEGRHWLEGLLDPGPSDLPQLDVECLSIAALLALRQGDYVDSARLLERAHGLASALEDREALANIANTKGMLAGLTGDFAEARACFEESVAAWRVLDGESDELVSALGNLGRALLDDGQVDEAEQALEESLELARRLGSRTTTSWALGLLGRVAAARGDLGRAERHVRSALRELEAVRFPWMAAEWLEELATIASRVGDHTRSGRLWGAAEALRAEISAPLGPAEVRRHESALRGLRAGRKSFADAVAEGRALTLEAAVAYALASID